MGDIEFQEIQDQLTPDQQIETDWYGGAFTLPRTTKKVLLVGGSANYNNTVRQMHGVAQAVTDYGEGSSLAGMVEKFLKVPGASKIPLYTMSIAAGSGSATLDVTLTTTATSAGVFRLWLAGRRFEVGVATDDTPTVIADAMVAEVNAKKYNLPVGITAAVGVLTITATEAGAAGNTIRVQTELTCTGTTSDVEDAPLASGTTDTDPSTALAGVESERYHIIAIHSEDTTAQASLEAHCTSMSAPAEKKWCMGICASVGTGATAQAYADTELLRLDMFFVLGDMVANPGDYGIVDPCVPCLSFFVKGGAMCDDADGRLFWDGIHPTTTGHRGLADCARTALGLP